MPKISKKSYLLRAIHEWCTDSGYTPYLAAKVDTDTRVPIQFAKDREIVLNISFEATNGLSIDEESVSFSARFGGISQPILVKTSNVTAIYAHENGQGMVFEESNVIAMINNDIITGEKDYLTHIDTVEKPKHSSEISGFANIGHNPSGIDIEKGQKTSIKDRKPTLTRIK
jgi:stringent starvation protein B